MEELGKKIMGALASIEGGSARRGREAQALDNWAFLPIPSCASRKKTIFLDGGIQPLIESAPLSLYLARIYHVAYSGRKRQESGFYEFHILVVAEEREGALSYRAEIVTLKGSFSFPQLVFSYEDRTLMTGDNQVEASALGNPVRRLAELAVATQLGCNDSLIVLDGSSDAKFTHEQEFLSALAESAKSRTCSVACLSKTSALQLSGGDSAFAYLERSAPKKQGWYLPSQRLPLQRPLPGTFLARLHERSDHILRLDFPAVSHDVPELISMLSYCSTDPVFLGYPYGLVEADRLARVQNSEKEQALLRVLSSLGKGYRRLIPYLRAGDAHSILDRMR
jgi:hypothetical protein